MPCSPPRIDVINDLAAGLACMEEDHAKGVS
jgi:hypothetical protein